LGGHLKRIRSRPTRTLIHGDLGEHGRARTLVMALASWNFRTGQMIARDGKTVGQAFWPGVAGSRHRAKLFPDRSSPSSNVAQHRCPKQVSQLSSRGNVVGRRACCRKGFEHWGGAGTVRFLMSPRRQVTSMAVAILEDEECETGLTAPPQRRTSVYRWARFHI
jgi:hypothetical protein